MQYKHLACRDLLEFGDLTTPCAGCVCSHASWAEYNGTNTNGWKQTPPHLGTYSTIRSRRQRQVEISHTVLCCVLVCAKIISIFINLNLVFGIYEFPRAPFSWESYLQSILNWIPLIIYAAHADLPLTWWRCWDCGWLNAISHLIKKKKINWGPVFTIKTHKNQVAWV